MRASAQYSSCPCRHEVPACWFRQSPPSIVPRGRGRNVAGTRIRFPILNASDREVKPASGYSGPLQRHLRLRRAGDGGSDFAEPITHPVERLDHVEIVIDRLEL